MMYQLKSLTERIADLETKTYTKNDLGMTFENGVYTFKVWSPHAKMVHLNLYETGDINDDSLIIQMPMTLEDNVWTKSIEEEMDGLFYTYQFNHVDYKTEAPDLYSRAVGLNGDRTAIIDLKETDPEGWDQDKHVMQKHITDAVIWEVHVEDFSSDAAFSIFSLSLRLVSFTIRCQGVDLFLLILRGVLRASWILMPVSFLTLGKFSAIICSNILSAPLSLSFSSGIPIILMLFRLIVSLISRILPS